MASCYKRVNFYDLCRLCAQNIHKNKTKIFSQDGLRSQLQSKIKKCFAINVKEDDCLPKVVCYRCIKQLEMCNTFREECLNSETMLSSYFKNYRHTEEFKKSGKVYIKDTNVVPVVSEPSPSKHQTKPSEHIKNPKLITDKPFSMEGDIPRHPKSVSQAVNSRNGIYAESKIVPPAEEPIVQMPLSFDTLNEALKKVVQQLPKELLNKVIVNSEGEVINLFPQEVEIAHPLPPNKVLKKSTKRKEKKIISSEMYNNIVKIDLTNEENEKYGMLPSLKSENPVTSQSSNPSVIFPVPQSQFQNATFNNPAHTDNFYTHQATVNIPSANRTVINVVCSADSTNPDGPSVPSSVLNSDCPSSINMEDLQPTDENFSVKVHTCEVCSKTFKRREHLYQHMKLHTGFRPYQCGECKKSFVRKEHLMRHRVLHSGERNFSCDICGKSFSRHDNLLKHIRTHNKEPSYTCDICQKVFIIKHYYEAHRSTEHSKLLGMSSVPLSTC